MKSFLAFLFVCYFIYLTTLGNDAHAPGVIARNVDSIDSARNYQNLVNWIKYERDSFNSLKTKSKTKHK